MTQHINVGFMPLLDSALLIAAQEAGFAGREGLTLTFARETSWANIRDRLEVGHFQVTHILAPMPIAGNLGLSPLGRRIYAPMALGLGGNAITVSNTLWQAMTAQRAMPDLDPRNAGLALKAVVEARRRRSQSRLRFAVVHPYSGHNYDLRYWLAGSGVSPDADIEIVIIPPPLMPDALATGHIDGYCVGEPWNTAAVAKAQGHIITVKATIWKSSPEKVLGVEARWAENNQETLSSLLRALYRASLWCGDPDNREDLARILADAKYLGRPESWMIPALSGRIETGTGCVPINDFFVPHAKAATFPWISHALWFYSQMVRWGHVPHTPDNAAIAAMCYRPDLYRAALKPLNVALPGANAKVEGALSAPIQVGSAGAGLVLGPDGFFDGRVFDPERIDAYIADQAAKES